MADVKKAALRPEHPARKARAMYFPHHRVQQDVGGVSMTRQEFADECDVNVLMARYEKTGVWPLPPLDAKPRYLDVSDVPDLQGAMQVMIEAEAAFMSLPAIVRKEFDNDKLKFVEFAQDPANLDQMRIWGLAPPKAADPAPVRVEVVGELPKPTVPPSTGGVATQ